MKDDLPNVPVRILHLEDDPVDASLALELLEEDGLVAQSERVDTLAAFKKALEQTHPELILADYSIPGLNALEALRIARQIRPEVPLVFLSGTLGEDVAIETLKLGATDYVVKQRIERLVPAVRRALHESRELSHRKEIEQALVESEARFRTLTESLPQLVWTADPTGNWDYVSRQWVEYTGIPATEQLGDKWLESIYPGERSSVLVAWQAALAGRADYDLEFRLRAANGAYRWFKTRARPLRNGEGQITKWFGTCTDISDIVEAREALARDRDDLEKLIADRTRQLRETLSEQEAFSFSLSHDMRAPLRAIRGFTEIVLGDSQGELPGPTVELLQKVRTAAEHMDRLIADVLELSRVSRQPIKIEPVEIEKLVLEIIRDRPELQPPRAEIKVESPLLPMLGHAASLNQCLTNLLTNAVKFVGRGITPRVRVYSQTREDKVRLWVEDNGIGIPPEAQGKIFEVFQRLHPASVYEGTGIGLAIVRKAIDRMNGQVGVESASGKGSRFWIELPKGLKIMGDASDRTG